MEHNETRFTIFGAQTHLLRPLQVGVVMLWYSGQPKNSGGQPKKGRTRAPEHFVGTTTGADEQLGCKNVGDDSRDIRAPNRVRFVLMAF